MTTTTFKHWRDVLERSWRWARLFLNRGGGQGEALSSIVADLCGRAGLGLADIDLAELGASVPGYVIGRQPGVVVCMSGPVWALVTLSNAAARAAEAMLHASRQAEIDISMARRSC